MSSGSPELRVRILRVRSSETESLPPLPLPEYATALAAGMDLRADVAQPIELAPFARALVPTGVAIELPPGWEGQVRPRSGLALKHGVTCLNSPGTIDADYRGELRVILANLSQTPFTLQRGDRIAQLVLAKVARISWEEVTGLTESGRGGGGFGSTGR